MKMFSDFTMVVYTIIFLVIGAGLIGLSLGLISANDVHQWIEYLYTDFNTQVYVGLAGFLVILYSLVTFHVTLGNIRREKTIAFDNPSGQVTISLTAIEDFIKKTAAHIPEVKELKPDVRANKKGINIDARVVVYSDSHIPEATEKVQGILRTRIQEMLGIEEPVNIKVHIAKIVEPEHDEGRGRGKGGGSPSYPSMMEYESV